MAAAISEGDGRVRLACYYDSEGLKHCLTDMVPHLSWLNGWPNRAV